jgi:hypothetical protein
MSEVAEETTTQPEAQAEPQPEPPPRPIITKLRIFIILSAGAHLGFLVCWGVPAYVKHVAELRAIEEEKQRVIALKEAEKRGKIENERQKIEKTVEDVEKVLKQDFDKIVQDDLSKKQKEEIWKEVEQGLDAKLNEYAHELSDNNATDADLESRLEDLKGAMVAEMDKDLHSKEVKLRAEDFVKAVEDSVVPKVADNFRKSIEKSVGAPLSAEGAKIVRDEKNLVDREREALKGSLDTAVRQADKAAGDLAAAHDHIVKVAGGNDQLVKDAKDRETAFVKGEEASLDQTDNQIKSAIDSIKSAGEKVADASIKEKIDGAVKNEGGDATKETEGAKDAASKGDGSGTKKHVGAASDAVKKLGDDIAKIKGAIDGGSGDAKSKAAAKADLDNAQKQANAAATGLKGVGDRMDRASTGTAQASKAGDAQVAAVAKAEAAGIGRAEGELKDAEDKLKKASGSAVAFGDDLKNKIDGAADNEGKAAEGKIGVAKEAAKSGGLSDLEHGIGDAADAAKKLADAAHAARDAADKAAFDPSALARAVMKGLEDKDIKGEMDKAFKDNFEKNAVPRLTKKLGDAFAKSLDADGISDDSAVAEVRSEIEKILKDKVPGMTKAGAASTDALDKSENLGSAKDSDNTNDARAKSVAGRVKKAVDGLAGKQMSDVTSDGSGDDSEVALAMGDGASQGKHGKHGKGGKDGGAAGAAGADGGDGDGEGGGDLAGLTARVSHLARNVKGGRMGILEGDAGGVGDGDDSPIPGQGGGKGAGKGNGLGGPDGPGGAGGIGAVASLRKNAMSRNSPNGPRGLGGGSSLMGSYNFNKDEHAKMVEGIADRDSSAKGEEWERKGAVGEVSTAEASKDAFKYGTVIAPATPTAAVEGTPAPKEPFKPKFKLVNNCFAAIPYLREPIKLDGDLSKWKDIPAIYLTPCWDASKNPSLKVYEKQMCKIAWDNTGIYLCYDYKAADNQIHKVKPNVFWEGDGVEIFVDTRNTKDKLRGSTWTQQFWFWPFGMAGDDSKTGGEARMDKQGNVDFPAYTANEIQRAAKKTADGWTMEVHIPFERLKDPNLQPGRIVGLNLSICTGTNLYYYWAGTSNVRTSEHPETWGDVLLAGSDGKLEAVDKLTSELKPGETSKTLNSIVIGEPLKLRVTDPDMNLSDKRKDKLSVTVRSRGSGESQVVILEETGEKTGVFEGAIRTDLNLGESTKGTVSLFEGETIEVIYLDQARANGSRNVEVKLPIKTAAGVMNLASSK